MRLQRNILFFLFMFVFGYAQAKNINFKLEAVPLPKAVGMIYDEVLEKPYMLDPKLEIKILANLLHDILKI